MWFRKRGAHGSAEGAARAAEPAETEPREHVVGGGPEARQPRAVPFHPLLIAAFPILALYAHNVGQLTPGEIARPLGMALLGACVLWATIALVARHVRKAAVAASAFVLVFFSYGHVMNVLPTSLRGLVVPGCALGLVAVLIALYRSRGRLAHATVVFNLASVVLLAPSCWAIGAELFNASHTASMTDSMRRPRAARGGSDTVRLPDTHHPKAISAAKAAKLPDIYYIILDAYGRADRLKQFYGYDNEPFLRALAKRGFYVARNSRSNYDQTPLCLSSALNMTYLDDLARRIGPNNDSAEPLREMIDDNAVADYLRTQGYHYVYVWTGAGQTRVDTADLILDMQGGQSQVSPLERQMLGLTAFDMSAHQRKGTYDQHRDFIQTAFRNLDTVARLPYPKFVFAHILSPHPPFVFGPHGEAVDPPFPITYSDGSWLLQMITPQQYRDGYVGQLQYVNRRVLEAVDSILRQSRRQPIIILQGDHGSRMTLDWDSESRTDLRETFSILNAYLVPPAVRKRLYDAITPVNSFRTVLSAQFGAKFPPLPDRTYYSTAATPLDFSEVTRLIPTPGSPADLAPPQSVKSAVPSEAAAPAQSALKGAMRYSQY